METPRMAFRSADPTLDELLEETRTDLMDVLERRFSGETYQPTKWESLSKLSPAQARLLSSGVLAMQAHLALQSCREKSGSGIGLLRLRNFKNWPNGYEKVLLLLECMQIIAYIDQGWDELFSQPI
jgi:hypothetical protein